MLAGGMVAIFLAANQIGSSISKGADHQSFLTVEHPLFFWLANHGKTKRNSQRILPKNKTVGLGVPCVFQWHLEPCSFAWLRALINLGMNSYCSCLSWLKSHPPSRWQTIPPAAFWYSRPYTYVSTIYMYIYIYICMNTSYAHMHSHVCNI